jgi:hypothetical protein
MIQNQEQDARKNTTSQEVPKPVPKVVTYPDIVARMFATIVNSGGNHQDAKKILVDWYNKLSPEERIAFKADQETVQITLKRCESAVDVIKQETAYVVHRFEQGS